MCDRPTSKNIDVVNPTARSQRPITASLPEANLERLHPAGITDIAEVFSNVERVVETDADSNYRESKPFVDAFNTNALVTKVEEHSTGNTICNTQDHSIGNKHITETENKNSKSCTIDDTDLLGGNGCDIWNSDHLQSTCEIEPEDKLNTHGNIACSRETYKAKQDYIDTDILQGHSECIRKESYIVTNHFNESGNKNETNNKGDNLSLSSINALEHAYTGLDNTAGNINFNAVFQRVDKLQVICENLLGKIFDVTSLTMGNQNAAKKPPSDDDTPDESKTQCCEIPKRKLKDRNNRNSRSSKSEDNDFDANEIYPFDNRSKSDPEILEPVDLDPFEIIETDDIKFVAGAGTSDVIKSASDAKFKAIPEEASFELEDDFDIMEQQICFGNNAAPPKSTERVVIDKGDRIVESGTTTAHSTFEFKQVKGKSKLNKPESDPLQHEYANIKVTSGNDNENAQTRPTYERSASSSSSSKEGSGKSSKDASRKNSKEAIVKPVRQSKPRKKSDSDKDNGKKRRSKPDPLSVDDETLELPAEPVKTAVVPPIQKNENHLVLTQTMFVKSKKTSTEEDSDKPQDNVNEGNSGAKTKYENVDVCAKLLPTGISIGHKDEPQNKPKAKNVKLGTQREDKEYFTIPALEKKAPTLETVIGAESDQPTTQSDKYTPSECGPDREDCTTQDPDNDTRSDVLATENASSHIYASIRSTVQSAGTSYDQCFDGCTEKNGAKGLALDVLKANQYGARIESKQEKKSSAVANEGKTADSLVIEEKECVPPPSPNTMCILEEEEEEEDEDVNIEDEEEKQKSAEIVEFSENVCKRLSQLLESMEASDDSDLVENDVDEDNLKPRVVSENVYETISDDFKSNYKKTVSDDNVDFVHEMKMSEPLQTSTTKKDADRRSNTEEYSHDKRRKKRHKRKGSSDTLKRKSNETVIYRPTEFSDSFSSSLSSEDDGMPEYFDPRGMPPKRGSEILCDVIDAYTDDIVEEVSAKEIADIANAHKLNMGSVQETSPESATKSDKIFRLPLQSFDSGLVHDAPAPVRAEELSDRTPTAEVKRELTALPELAKAEEGAPVQYNTSGRQSVTCTESDLDISEQRDDISTDSMLADDEEEETMEILLTKTYTEPVEGAEVFLSCTVVNSAYKTDQQNKQKATWLSNEALEYFEANAANVMSTAFIKAKREMKDIQICLQSLRKQMEHFHDDCDDISLPDIPVDSLSPDYMAELSRKAMTD